MFYIENLERLTINNNIQKKNRIWFIFYLCMRRRWIKFKKKNYFYLKKYVFRYYRMKFIFSETIGIFFNNKCCFLIQKY